MKILYLLLLISSTASASPYSSLYAKVKDNHVCVFTKGDYNKAPENETLLYMGKVDGINTFHDSYSRTYFNLKMPINKENCIKINKSEFNGTFPYSIWLETDKEYNQRICVNQNPEGKIVLLEAKADLEKGTYCGTNQYDYSSNSLWTKLKNLYYWIVSLLN
ncbi:NF045616 family extracytoplasmic (lipo)protein [Acinetobacter sp. NIPH 2100]|uniref:NF045616 family extracytoplasmic (lipo)protein n=1 Tax=Acinetobacter sp. NIPH 2100 TaxID=1217708 RepID=UPI0002CFF62C|nr:NF045616 family extracytoplasmic (lipo)protein [Acinetobacter sp. NIPH 2100]ENX39207.1 hypothetical protein F887_03088 [Acinetobacter sp. NIPH 2100]